MDEKELSIKQQEAEVFRKQIMTILKRDGALCAYDIAKRMLGDDRTTLHRVFVNLNVKLGRHLKVLESKGLVTSKGAPANFPDKTKIMWTVI